MTRRVAFHKRIDESSSIYDLKDLTKIKMSKLRTFITFECYGFKGIGFMLLRVLELRNATIGDLPTDLKNMIHLRYLGLRETGITVIPSWIDNLKNLQTFDIKRTVVELLPKSFWNITSLRHVHCSAVQKIKGPPSHTYRINLRSLGNFRVPKSWKRCIPFLPGVCKLKLECQEVNDGKLIHELISKLNYLHSVRFDNFYPPRERIDFSTSRSYYNIHTMYLSGYKLGDPPTVQIVEMPPKLTKLTLSLFDLNDDPMPKLEKLHSLKYLELIGISIEGADIIVCTNGGFPQLQSLKLADVKKMKVWEVESRALPELKYLLIKDCRDLWALPDLQHVTTIQELEVDKELRSKIENNSGKEWDKVKHITTIKTC